MTDKTPPAKADPRVRFYRMIPDIRLPQRADRSAAGSLPTRAFRYCEPVTTASAFGYYVFTPLNFTLVWDGHDIQWTYEGNEHGWMPLTRAQYPYFPTHFNERAPAEIKGFSPPMLASLQEPGLVNIWSGLIARTMPGWSLLVRPPVNFARRGGYELFEGIIETDRWSTTSCLSFRCSQYRAKPWRSRHRTILPSPATSRACNPRTGTTSTTLWCAPMSRRTAPAENMRPRRGAGARPTRREGIPI